MNEDINSLEYIAGRNQASRQYHMAKRKEAEAEVVALRKENDRLREALGVVASMGSVPDNLMITAVAAIAKEALK